MSLKSALIGTFLAGALGISVYAQFSAGLSAGAATAFDGNIRPAAFTDLSFLYRSPIGKTDLFRFSADGALIATSSSACEKANIGLSLLYSRLFGMNALGLHIETNGAASAASDTGFARLALSVPLTVNGQALSWEVEPMGEWRWLSGAFSKIALTARLSIPAGELVIKPIAAASYTHYSDGNNAYSASPSVDIFWYPGFPLSASAGLELIHDMADSGQKLGESIYARFSIAASPSALVMLSAEAATAYTADVLSFLINTEMTLYPFSSERPTISFPIKIQYANGSFSPNALDNWEASVGARFGF